MTQGRQEFSYYRPGGNISGNQGPSRQYSDISDNQGPSRQYIDSQGPSRHISDNQGPLRQYSDNQVIHGQSSHTSGNTGRQVNFQAQGNDNRTGNQCNNGGNNGGSGNTWYNHTSHGSVLGVFQNRWNNNHYSYVTQMVLFATTELRRMPITSSNDLPHCFLVLGQSRSSLLLSVLFDTIEALTIGYLPTHKKIMDNNPKAVHNFEEFDGPNPFDPIKLTGAITNTEDYDASKHGILSAVVGYFTPYRDTKGNRLLIPVALGMEMAVDTILGNTVINQWGMELKYNPPMITSHKLRETFELKYHST